MGSDLEVLGREKERMVCRVIGVEKIGELGEMWQEDVARLKDVGSECNEDIGKFKTYLECMQLMGKIAKDLMSLNMGDSGGEGDDILKKLGINV